MWKAPFFSFFNQNMSKKWENLVLVWKAPCSVGNLVLVWKVHFFFFFSTKIFPKSGKPCSCVEGSLVLKETLFLCGRLLVFFFKNGGTLVLVWKAPLFFRKPWKVPF